MSLVNHVAALNKYFHLLSRLFLSTYFRQCRKMGLAKSFVKIFEFLVIFIPIFDKKSNFLRTNEVLPIEKANAMFHLPDH